MPIMDKIDYKLNILHPDLGEKMVYKYTENDKNIANADFFDSRVIVIKYTNGNILMYNFRTGYVYSGKSDNKDDIYPLSGKSHYSGKMEVRYGDIFITSTDEF